MHESKEMFRFTGTKIVIPTFECVCFKNTQMLDNLLCPQQASGTACRNQVVICYGGARFVNVTSVSPAITEQIAAGAPAGTQIFADSVVGNAIVGRMYINPVAASKLQNPIDTRIDVSARAIANVKAMFGKFFSNSMAFAQLGQQGSFGMNVKVALKVDLTGLNTNSLVAYVYDAKTNAYTQLAKPWVDSNGFVHITTSVGGAVVITDSPLKLK